MKENILIVFFLFFIGLPLHLYAQQKSEVEEIYNSYCGLCHQLPDPDWLTKKQWKVVLGTMQKRMQEAGMEPLTEEELKQVMEYLEKHSRK